MRRILEEIVLLVGLPFLDFADLFADRNHRVTEAVQLGE